MNYFLELDILFQVQNLSHRSYWVLVELNVSSAVMYATAKAGIKTQFNSEELEGDRWELHYPFQLYLSTTAQK
jgi:hypothetical protein